MLSTLPLHAPRSHRAALLAFCMGAALSSSALADAMVWVAAAGGNWEDRFNWSQGGVTPAARPPRPGDSVTIDGGAGAVRTITLNSAPAAGVLAYSFTTMSVTGRAALRLPQADAVVRSRLSFTVTAGNFSLGSDALISTQRGAGVNADGCDLEVHAPAGRITLNGQLIAGGPVGTALNGGSVKLTSNAANGNAIAIVRTVADTAVAAGSGVGGGYGGDVTLDAARANVWVEGSIAGGHGGAGGGAGGLAGDIYVYGQEVRLVTGGDPPQPRNTTAGRGGNGNATGGRGGNVTFGTAERPLASLTVSRGYRLAGGQGGQQLVANANPGTGAGTGAGGVGGQVWITATGPIDNAGTLIAADGGNAASDGTTRTRAGAGGPVYLVAGSLTNRDSGTVQSGGGGTGDYAGGGGAVSITVLTDCTNQGFINAGVGSPAGTGRISAVAPGDARPINGNGGGVTILGGRDFTNTRSITSGYGGGVTAPAGAALRGTGWRGGHIRIVFLNTVRDTGRVVAGAAGIFGGAYPKANAGNRFLQGLSIRLGGDKRRAAADDGTPMNGRSEYVGLAEVILLPDLLASDDTVKFTSGAAGLIYADQDASGHARIEANSLIRCDTGCSGLTNFNAVSPAFGPLMVIAPQAPEDLAEVQLTQPVTPSLPSLGSIIHGTIVLVTSSIVDYNGDGFVDFFDYDDFVRCFETGECPAGRTADYNGDGFADFFDYDDFVAAFERGC